jgi:glutamyl-tRNA synthetase
MATGRYAPSPTGPLHLGNLRTAVAAWLFARSAGSRFVYRVEDLDGVAGREEHVVSHQEDLHRLGLDWDGPLVRQSDRRPEHDAVLDGLARDGLLYPCYCTRREVLDAARAPHGRDPDGAYPGTCRDLTAGERAEREATGRAPAWRLRTSGGTVSFTDRVAGPVVGTVDDFVVRRRDGSPAYNLAVVVDDAHQGVEEVVRGDDLIPTTPRQIHLAGVLGVPVPVYAHVPLVVGEDGARLAKRHGSVTLADRVGQGATPTAVLALLARSLGIEVAAEEEAGPAAALAAALVPRFAPAAIPLTPWTLPSDPPTGGANEG